MSRLGKLEKNVFFFFTLAEFDALLCWQTKTKHLVFVKDCWFQLSVDTVEEWVGLEPQRIELKIKRLVDGATLVLML